MKIMSLARRAIFKIFGKIQKSSKVIFECLIDVRIQITPLNLRNLGTHFHEHKKYIAKIGHINSGAVFYLFSLSVYDVEDLEW